MVRSSWILGDCHAYSCRPVSENARWEEPPQEGEPFNYDAVPEKFYFGVESVGNLDPDQIIQQGIKVLQQKLALVIQDATDDGSGQNGTNGHAYDAPRSPDVNMNGGWGPDQGYTTPFGNSGQAQWNGAGAGGTTPYGATPYGQNGY